MKTLKAIHDLFLFEDDLFRYEAEIIRNEPCAGMGQNSSSGSMKESELDRLYGDFVYILYIGPHLT